MKNQFLLPLFIVGFCLMSASRMAAQSFTNLPFYGSFPDGRLVIFGKTLYGTASASIFAVNTDGSGYTSLHSFTNGSDGISLYTGLTLSGNPGNFVLYGTAVAGGDYGGKGMGAGTVFCIYPITSLNTTNWMFNVFHMFTGGWDGGGLYGGVILSGDTLYGTAEGGGTNGTGTIFATTDVYDGLSLYGGEQILHTFGKLSGPVYTNSDGAYPMSGLVLSGNALYGTASGGRWGSGTVFAVNTDGTGFTNLYNFTATDENGNNNDGANPVAGLILSGNTLYGTAQNGGVSHHGTVFSLSLPPPQLTITSSTTNVILTWPTYAPGVTLECTTNLGSAAVWNTNLLAPNLVNGQNAVTNPFFGTQQFFRLSQ
jgi:uncharacterized repeat protein (TIGR03803 family)